MKWLSKLVLVLCLAIGTTLAALAVTIGYTASCPDSPEAVNGSELMKAVRHRCYGPPDVLEFVDHARPQPGHTEIQVKVANAGVNPLDWHYMRGTPYLLRLMSGIGTPTDTRLGVDFAGTVSAVGPGVSKFKVGDRVFGGTTGAFAEYITVDQDRSVSPVPAGISLQQAAAVPIAGVSALQALRDLGKLQVGQKVLINGASGGVGTFAVQIAKAMGAEVSGVCSTRNVEMVKSLGADRVFDYKRENYTEGPASYDLIIDNVGNHPISDNLGVLKPGGRLVMVGGAKGNWIAPVIAPVKSMLIAPFVDQELLTLFAQMNQGDLTVLAGMMRDGQLGSVIDREFTLAETAEAIRYSETGRARGKIVIGI